MQNQTNCTLNDSQIMKKADWHTINNAIASIDWIVLFLMHPIDECVELLTDVINRVISIYIFIKKSSQSALMLSS